MFKKLFYLSLILFLPFGLEANNYTFRVFAGHNRVSLKALPNLKVSVQDGQIIGGAIGYRISDIFRAELEGSYRNNFVSSQMVKGGADQFIVPLKGKMESVTICGNVLITWPYEHFLQPYIGFGIGTTSEHSDWVIALMDNNVWLDMQDGKRSGTSYQALAGIHLPPHNGIYCGLEFRILDSVLDHMVLFNRSLLFSVRKEF